MFVGDDMKKQTLQYKTEETEEMKKFFLVLFIVIIVIILAFVFSSFFLKDEAKDYEYQTGQISTTTAIVGTILNNPESEYYVLAYDTNGVDANSYVTYGNYYKSNQKNAVKIYYLNLNSAFNKDYYVTENSNPKAKKISELKMKDGTLLHIKNGKIIEYIEGIDKIASKLKVN